MKYPISKEDSENCGSITLIKDCGGHRTKNHTPEEGWAKDLSLSKVYDFLFDTFLIS
jgi:hypothetical protein